MAKILGEIPGITLGMGYLYLGLGWTILVVNSYAVSPQLPKYSARNKWVDADWRIEMVPYV